MSEERKLVDVSDEWYKWLTGPKKDEWHIGKMLQEGTMGVVTRHCGVCIPAALSPSTYVLMLCDFTREHEWVRIGDLNIYDPNAKETEVERSQIDPEVPGGV